MAVGGEPVGVNCTPNMEGFGKLPGGIDLALMSLL